MRLAVLATLAGALLAIASASCERAPRSGADEDPAAARRAGAPAVGRQGDRHARAAARRAPTVKRVEGTLARADDRQVVIRAPGAPAITLRVAPSTTATVNGRPARVESLREGAEVRASYRVDGGGRPTALVIEAEERPRARGGG